MPQDSCISVQNVSWQPQKSKPPILKEVSASFSPGAFTVLLGPNGAGKTSLLRQILGFIRPQSGQILVAGHDIRSYSRRDLAKEIAYLPQSPRSSYELPVSEVIKMARFSYLKPFEQLGPQDIAAVDEAVARSGCEQLFHQIFAQLSGGERQRVLCARAMAQESRFILLDEPVSNLDLKYQHTILAALKNLVQDKGVGIICVMHDINLSQQYADQVVLLEDGQVVAQGPRREILQAERLTQVYGWPLDLVQDGEGNSFFVSRATSPSSPGHPL